MNDFFRRMDFITSTPLIFVNSDKRFKHTIGGILSIFFLFFFSLFCFIKINNFFYRKKVFVVSNQELSSNTNLEIKNIPFLFQIYDKSGQLFEDSNKIFSFDSYIMNSYDFFHNQIFYDDVKYNKMNIDKCLHYNKTSFLYKDIFDNSSNEFICFDPNQNKTLSGIFEDESIKSSLVIEIKKCVNSTKYANCSSSNKIYDQLKNSYFKIRFVDYVVNNHDFHNPIHSLIQQKIFKISDKFSKFVSMEYQLHKYSSKNGYFSDYETSENFVKINNFYEKFSNNKEDSNVLIRINLSLSSSYKNIIRNFEDFESILSCIVSIGNLMTISFININDILIDSYFLNYVANFINLFGYLESDYFMNKRKTNSIEMLNDLNKSSIKSIKFRDKFNSNEMQKNEKMKTKIDKKLNPTNLSNNDLSSLDLNFSKIKINSNEINIEKNDKKDYFRNGVNFRNQRKFSAQSFQNPNEINKKYIKNSIIKNKIELDSNENNITNQNIDHLSRKKNSQKENINIENDKIMENRDLFTDLSLDFQKIIRINYLDIVCIKMNNIKEIKLRNFKLSEKLIKNKLSIEIILKKIMELDKKFLNFDEIDIFEKNFDRDLLGNIFDPKLKNTNNALNNFRI